MFAYKSCRYNKNFCFNIYSAASLVYTDPKKSKCYISHNSEGAILCFSLRSIGVVKMSTLPRCIVESDIVMILEQSGAGKAGWSLQLASLLCQHYFNRLQ